MSSKKDGAKRASGGSGRGGRGTRFGGAERRRPGSDKAGVRGEVRFDDKGNPVWEVRVDTPRRRENDETFDLLKALDVETLELESGDDPDDGPGYDPYGHDED